MQAAKRPQSYSQPRRPLWVQVVGRLDINFANTSKDRHISAAVSGEYTRKTDPPILAIQSAINWVQLGQYFLAQILRNFEIDEARLAFDEHATVHENEGDIVRTAGIYLVHPICQALWANQNLQGTVVCQSEASTSGTRADLTFYCTSQSPNDDSRPVAVIGLKKRGVINAPPSTTSKERNVTLGDAMDVMAVVNNQQYWAAKGHQEPDNTFFGGIRRYCGSKLHSAYATSYGTQFVALFNWDYLVLVHFTQMDPRVTNTKARQDNGVGEYCESTIIPYKDSDQMCPALLGFLALAYQNTP